MIWIINSLVKSMIGIRYISRVSWSSQIVDELIGQTVPGRRHRQLDDKQPFEGEDLLGGRRKVVYGFRLVCHELNPLPF